MSVPTKPKARSLSRLAARVGYLACGLLMAACPGANDDQSAEPPDGNLSDSSADAAAPGDAAELDAGAPADDPDPELSDDTLARLAKLSPAVLPAPKPDLSNTWADDPRAAALGQKLFFDPRFAGPLLDGDNDSSPFALGKKGDVQKVACAGCHVPEDGFSDTRSIRKQISLGAGWGKRRAPSLLDVGQSVLFNWDGHRDSLQAQIFGPMQSEVEMNTSRLFAGRQLFVNHRTEYEALFGPMPNFTDTTRFPVLTAEQTGCSELDADSKCTGKLRGEPGDGAEFDGMTTADQDALTRTWINAGKAIAAYERLLTCGESDFDRWLRGDATALDRAAQRGAALFVGKANCVSCHDGPFLSDDSFHNVGLKPTAVATVFLDANDRGAGAGIPEVLASPLNVKGAFSDGDDGRLAIAIDPKHEGAFKTPRLRCVSGRPSFMHTGQLTTLEAVVNFFSRGGDMYGFPGTNELQVLSLSPREVTDIVAFLRSLQGTGPAASLLTAP